MALVICPDCGKEQDNANRFCGNCGADLSKVEPIPEKEEIISDATDESVLISQEKTDSAEDSVLVREETSTDPIEEKVDETALKKCPDCGRELIPGAKFCPNCGANVESANASQINVESTNVPQTGMETKVTPKQTTVTTMKNPVVAAILSFIFPGIGQLYIGQNNKGGLFIVLAAVSILLMLLLIGFILYVLFWLWAIFDAYTSAVKLNDGEIVEDKLF
ncbi:zinc-ribbon domain-containing protein [Methanobrevibacter sp.]|uniref:zinc-ribbon domain-containing protein n=1 Tax=Methanobrevibacter sp. TaxID=66852 RepID=UPI0038901552